MPGAEQGLINVDADVLVVGGGVAGCMAAILAGEGGARVVVADKGRLLERAGSVGGGVDHYMTVLESGPDWDTPDYLLGYVPDLTDGIVDLEVTERHLRAMAGVFRKLESLGVDFRDPITGAYYRHRALGFPATYHLNFDGTRFKERLGKAARRQVRRFLPRTMITGLLVRDGRVYGAAGFSFRTGQACLIRAKAVVISTGDVNRLGRNASGHPFDSWHLPYNTGDGLAMGYRAGAGVVNMEFVEATLTPKGFSSQGTNAVCGAGAHLVNRHGDRFMLRYDPLAEKARRAVLIDAISQEVLRGNGPVYLDLRHLPEEELVRLEATLGVDRYTLPSFYRQKGVDLRRDLIEISVSEVSVRKGGLFWRGSGLVVDAEGRTSVDGLLAAGDCSSVNGGISEACVGGALAGRAAARAATVGTLPELTPRDRGRLGQEVLRYLGPSGSISPRGFEDRIRDLVTDYVGLRRTQPGLERALEGLRQLEASETGLAARDPHGLSRAHEAVNLRLVAEMVARSALQRRETRSGSSHRRLDYPARDDEHWLRFLVVQRMGAGMGVYDVPVGESLWSAVRARRGLAEVPGG